MHGVTTKLIWRDLGFVSYILAVVESYFWIEFPYGTFNVTISIKSLSEIPIRKVGNVPEWFTLFFFQPLQDIFEMCA